MNHTQQSYVPSHLCRRCQR